MPTEDDLYKPIVPGHPLYAQFTATEIFTVLFSEWRVPEPDRRAQAMLQALIRHDPPIFFCTSEEMKEN